MSENAVIKIDGDASGFIAATEESKKAASGMSEALQGAVGGSTGEAVKGLKGMDQEGRKACKRLNAGLINMSATITGVGAAINGLRAGWGKFSAMLAGGDDLERVTRRMEAFTGGASSAAEAARDVVDFADTPPFGLAETQRAAQLLLGCGVRASELKSTLESLGNVAAGGGMSLEQIGIRLSKAFQTGRVTMEVLEPLMNSGINVMGVLGQRTGKTRAELNKMMTTGKLGFRDLMGALVSMGSAGGQFEGAMEKNTQDIESRVETLKGKVGALSRIFAEPVTSGVKDAMDSIGASWAGHGPEVERGLRKTGELLGGIVKAAAPIVSAVGGGLASVAAGGGRVEKMIRSGILAWGAWKAVGMAANSSVGRSIQAAAAAFRVDYNNELRLAGGNMKRFDSAVRAVGLTAKRTWARMGADLAGSLRAEIHGQKDKLRVLQEQARVLELQNQYEADGMSKARAGAAAREIAALEQNRNRAQAGREYRRQMALLKAQAEGNKAEERRLKMAERMKEIYDQQRGLGIDRKTAMRRARGMAGLEDMVERRKDRKEGSGPIADSLAQVGGGGRSMMGSMPQLTEARKQTNLLQQIVKNTGAGRRGTLKTVARLGY